jgi:uncharacterized membrane protein YfcA
MVELDFLTTGTPLDLAWFLILCAVSFLGSFITASLGLGGGVLVLATMALALPPIALIPIHGVVQLGSNLGRSILLRNDVLLSILPAFIIGSILGVAIGTQFFIALPTQILQFILAIFIIYATWAPKFQASDPGKKTFFGVGAIVSFITMFVGATGPLVAPFISATTKDRKQIVATHATLMTFQHGLKIIAFGLLGFAFVSYVPLLVGMIGFGFIGTYIGRIVLLKLPEASFRLGHKVILTLLSLKLFQSALVS